VRIEGDWPRSNDPFADSIEPPAAGGKPASDVTATMPTRKRRKTMATKTALLSHHQAAAPDLPDLNAPEFAPLKARLARAYLDQKAASAHRELVYLAARFVCLASDPRRRPASNSPCSHAPNGGSLSADGRMQAVGGPAAQLACAKPASAARSSRRRAS
jgi:hypothetical protein